MRRRHLLAAGKAWWKRVTEQFEIEGHDLALLESCCLLLDRATAAREQLERDGLTQTDRFGPTKEHPGASIERNALLAFARIRRELGIDVPPTDSRPHHNLPRFKCDPPMTHKRIRHQRRRRDVAELTPNDLSLPELVYLASKSWAPRQPGWLLQTVEDLERFFNANREYFLTSGSGQTGDSGDILRIGIFNFEELIWRDPRREAY